MILILFLLLFSPFAVFAQFFHTPEPLIQYMWDAPEIRSRSAVLIDAATGALLYSKNRDHVIPPASLTKLMTMHLVMKEVEEGRASYDEIIPITVESWAQSQPPRSSLMFLEPGQIVTLREIMLGLAVCSGNDAAVAAALRVAPTMQEFVALMNHEARQMGLSVTRFTEASGYSPENLITADEFAYFCCQYINLHPESMKDFHSVVSFSYPTAANIAENNTRRIRTITQNNSNSLLSVLPEVDGLKTGYISESGYNVALTAQRYQNRFILVLLGAPSQRGGSRIRETDGRKLLTWALDNFKTVRVKMPVIDEAKLWKGKEKTAQLAAVKDIFSDNNGETLSFTSHISRTGKLKFDTVITSALIAPLEKNHHAGYLAVSDETGELYRVPLVTINDYKKGNIFKRFWHSVLLLFGAGNKK